MKKIYFSLLILLVGLLPQLSQAQSELWGVTTAGGDGFGSLYSMPTGSTGIAFQRNFTGASGSSPQQTRMIQASNGKLYGVLLSGGFNNLGVLFEYDITTNTFTKRYDFNTANGSSPRAALMQASDGKLYGTTSNGGANGVGVLFQFDISTNTYTKKYDFVVANGSQPFGGLVEPSTPNGKLYGMTRAGGTNSVGTIYEYDLATFAYTKKIDLSSTSGTLPFGELTASGSLFYGLTSAGGASSVGTLVEYDYGTNTLTKKYDFVAANGSSPQGTLFKASNNVLYGVTTAGGTNSVGVIFQYSVSTAAYTKLVDFVSANSSDGRGTLVQAANGKLYGLNRIGGANNNGAIYEYSISTSSYTKLFDLQNSVAIGGGPLGSLTYASNGKLYGLTTNGGIAGGGVIFEYDISTSAYTKKVDLNLAVAGGAANGGPVYAANGKIYGTAITGGTNNIGALYEYDRLTSTFTKKYDFVTASGSSPYGSMIEASNNKLYGMTNVGGVSGLGTIYEYNYTSNVYTKKIDLSATLGSLPFGNMVQAANGKLYGLTRSGGTSGLGVLFEYDYTTNVYTKKADLTTSTGSQPSGSLIEAPNGKLYGLTQLGGINNIGALIEYDYATNTLTKKIDLALANGSQPLGSLVLGPDGMLYGLTQLGGTNNLGALFQYDYTTNTYTKKVDLSATTGSTPKGSLIKANSGILYGVTTAAGTNSVGTHFSYNVTTNTFTKLLDFSQATGCTPGYTSLLEVCPKPENAGSIFSTGTSLCSGNSSSQTFSIAVLPSALSYTWSLPAGASITSGTLTNVITANLSGISPGAFTFSVGGVNTCGTGSLSTLAYSINSSPTVVVSNGTLCAGSAYTITPSGASTYTYSGGSNVVSPSITTNYTVTGTSAQGCISSSAAVLTVSVGALPVVTANSSTNAVCNGATVSLSGGGASSYTWSGGVTNGSAFTPTITTNYTVTGMDGNGCQNTAIKTVTVFALPTVSTVGSSTAICSGGTVSVSGSGASTYTWSGGVSNGVAFTPTLTNTYSVTGTDLNGCQNTASRAIVVNARPVVTANTSTSAVCIGGLITLTGGGASTYTWTGGATNNVAFAPSATTAYSVTGTSTAGCTSTNVANVSVTVNALPVVGASSSTPAVCAGQQVTLNGSGANTYTWTGGATNNVAFAPTSSTSYSVSGTSTAGCTSTNVAAVTVTVNALPVLTANSSTNVTCFGNNITLTGGGASTYTWSSSIGGSYSNGVAFTPTATATYSVIGTSTAGCNSANAAAVTVTINARPVVSANTSTSAVCIGFPVTLTGGGASTYTWTGGATNNVAFAPSTTTSYSVSGTSTAGCTSTNVANVTVTVYALPVVGASSSTPAVCAGQQVTLNGSGANTYTWTGGATNNVAFAPTSSTSYSVSGTSTAGCTSTNVAAVTVTVNALPVLTANSSTNVTCFGNNITLTGGGASTYTWSSSIGGSYSNGVAFTPTATATYSVIGTSTAGCNSAGTSVVTVTVNVLPVVSANTSTSAVCIGFPVTLSGSGASTYTWTGGVSNNVAFTPNTTVTYSVIGTSPAGCTSTNVANVTVTVYARPVVSANTNTTSVCFGQSVTLSGSGANTYTWTSPVSNGVAFAPASTTNYSVVGTSTAGCTSTNVANVTITVNPLPVLTGSASNPVICFNGTTSLNGTGATTYSWASASGTIANGVTFSPLSTDTYTLVGFSAFGCLSSNFPVVSITVNPLPTVTASSGTICSGQSYTIPVSGASTYTYSGGNIVSPTTTTNYSVTGTSTDGCVSSGPAVLTVTVYSLPVVSVNSGSICTGASIVLTPSISTGGAASYSFSGATSSVSVGSVIVSPTSTSAVSVYSVSATNSLGCLSSNVAVATVTVRPLPTVTVNNGVICNGAVFVPAPGGANSYTYSFVGSSVSPSVTSNYLVIGSNNFGCVSSPAVPFTVTVNQNPTVTISGSNSVCAGSSLTLTANGANTYNWNITPTSSLATIVVSPTANITYSVSGIDGNNCSNMGVLSVSVLASPTISALSGVICPTDVYTITPSGASTYTITGGTALVSPSVTTSYSVTGTNSLGCVSPIAAVVTVSVVNSVVVTISGNTVICAGQSVTLTAGGPSSFTWNASPTLTTATIVDTPTANTSYSVFGSTGACSNTAAINVLVNTLPTVNAASNTTLICVNESATLSASGASSYTWTPGSVGATQVVTPIVSTIYTVTGVDGNGCENVASIGLFVDACIGVKNVVAANTDLVLYPNPNQGMFNLVLSQSASLTVENSLGQVVLKEVLTEGVNQINLGENAKGMYFVRVKTGAVTNTIKVIKN